MPAFAVAASKRIEAGAFACVCATAMEDSSMSENSFTSVSSCAMRGSSGQIRGRGGPQKNLWYCILRCRFRASVASYADALLAAAHPEISSFALHSFARTIKQLELKRLFAGNLDEERSI